MIQEKVQATHLQRQHCLLALQTAVQPQNAPAHGAPGCPQGVLQPTVQCSSERGWTIITAHSQAWLQLAGNRHSAWCPASAAGSTLFSSSAWVMSSARLASSEVGSYACGTDMLRTICSLHQLQGHSPCSWPRAILRASKWSRHQDTVFASMGSCSCITPPPATPLRIFHRLAFPIGPCSRGGSPVLPGLTCVRDLAGGWLRDDLDAVVEGCQLGEASSLQASSSHAVWCESCVSPR